MCICIMIHTYPLIVKVDIQSYEAKGGYTTICPQESKVL